MRRIFESSLPKGFLDIYETEGHWIFSSAFRKGVMGVPIELPAKEIADLTEALLRNLDPVTRDSIIESVIREDNLEMVRRP